MIQAQVAALLAIIALAAIIGNALHNRYKRNKLIKNAQEYLTTYTFKKGIPCKMSLRRKYASTPHYQICLVVEQGKETISKNKVEELEERCTMIQGVLKDMDMGVTLEIVPDRKNIP